MNSSFMVSLLALSCAACGASAPAADTPPPTEPQPTTDAPDPVASAPTPPPPAPEANSEPGPELAKLIASCNNKEAPGVFDCITAGNHYRNGEGIAKDGNKALGFYTKVCFDMFAPPGCYPAADIFLKGEVPMDEEVFFKVALGACAPGTAEVCHEHGDRFRDGTGVKKDEAKAKQLYKKGCDELKDETSCKRL